MNGVVKCGVVWVVTVKIRDKVPYSWEELGFSWIQHFDALPQKVPLKLIDANFDITEME